MPTRVLLVGAGAIGAFYGSRLACAANVRVSALCRSNYKVVKVNGFTVTSPKYGETTFRPEYTFGSHQEAQHAAIDWDFLLVATKVLPEVTDNSTLLQGLVGPKTSIVLLQNGLGIEEPYRQRFPTAAILSAVTLASVAQPEPGMIKHNKWTKTSIGPYLARGTGESLSVESKVHATQATSRFVELLRAGGIDDAELLDHSGIQLVRWHKIAINAAMNPSSVLSGGSDNQTMSTDPELSRHLRAVMDEVLETASKVLGRPFPSTFTKPEQILKSTAKDSSGSKPSMLLDWQAGRRMELEVILGNPIRIAREHGIDMPRLQSMYALLRKAQQKRDNQTSPRL